MERKRTLLEKFGIPLNHLDFAYIEKCNNARELERIVKILRSGEEGYYPDLTKRAEEKLRQLKPDSTLFRFEEPIRGRHSLGPNEWKPIYDWTKAIKTKDGKLCDIKQQEAKVAKGVRFDLSMPPIRKSVKINESSSKDQANNKNSRAMRSNRPMEIIASTDYKKWDKYDPDEEMLKMDLAEERVKEEVERKNRLNLQKSRAPMKITELGPDKKETQENKPQDVLQKLTDIEREQLAEEYRVRGNEYFKVKEYDLAITEYDKAIKANRATAALAYNNRAIANIKLQKYMEAIDDCEHCLELDPRNVKALLRKAEACYHHGLKRESYDVYQKVLTELDANNTVALKATQNIRAQLGELAPPHATRLKIKEERPGKPSHSEQKTGSTAKPPSATLKAETQPSAKAKDYDSADLIKPNRVVNNKFASAAAALGQAMAKSKPPKAMPDPQATMGHLKPQVIVSPVPRNDQLRRGKVLIEEI